MDRDVLLQRQRGFPRLLGNWIGATGTSAQRRPSGSKKDRVWWRCLAGDKDVTLCCRADAICCIIIREQRRAARSLVGGREVQRARAAGRRRRVQKSSARRTTRYDELLRSFLKTRLTAR